MMTIPDPSALPKPEPTDEELRERFERAAERAGLKPHRNQYAENYEKGLSDVDKEITRVLKAVGVDREERPALVTYRCDGGCGRVVASRRGWCAECASRSRISAADIALREAWASVNPEGARDWCRLGNEDYRAAMLGTEQEPGIRRLYKKLLVDDPTEGDAAARAIRGADGEALFKRAEWDGRGSLLLLGLTGIGKTALLSAIANNLLDRARAGLLSREAFSQACGLRWVSANDLAKASPRHKLGDGTAPLIKMAKDATILFLDELGLEDKRSDPEVIAEVLRARYEPLVKTTFVASELTRIDLEKRYGASRIRTVWQRGRLIDLHPR